MRRRTFACRRRRVLVFSLSLSLAGMGRGTYKRSSFKLGAARTLEDEAPGSDLHSQDSDLDLALACERGAH